MAPLGVENYWLDAGWFEGGWPGGAGSWVPRTDAFPNGLKVVADRARKQGMGFVLWFEPERVTGISRIAKEHPEWVLRAGDGDGLYDLGNPDACKWLTDFLCKCIKDWGITVYRNDFNIDPLHFWQAADAPDRVGINEIRYIENLYKMWDEMRKRNPGLTIDNCASGGRRIDLEMISRSYPLWQSDTQCSEGSPSLWDQGQNGGLSLWVPLHAAGVWRFDPYSFRSITTTGSNLCPKFMNPDFPSAEAKKMIAEAKSLRPLWLGDYYPLFPININEVQWCGWQYDRPDMGEGFAMLFRRAQSPYSGAVITLHGIDPKASYEVEFVDSQETKTLKGSDLAHLVVKLDKTGTSVLVKYRKR